MEFKHVTVLLNEAVDILDIKPEGIYVDGTLGGAGHSLEIVKKLTSGKLICFDQDINAISAAKEKLKDFVRMSTTPYGLKTVFMCPITRRSGG